MYWNEIIKIIKMILDFQHLINFDMACEFSWYRLVIKRITEYKVGIYNDGFIDNVHIPPDLSLS